jgi:hypothetical protein
MRRSKATRAALVVLLIAGVATSTGCGSSREPAGRPDMVQRAGARVSKTAATSPDCPRALSPGTKGAYVHAAHASLSSLRGVLPRGFSTRNSYIQALYWLTSTADPRVPASVRGGPARKACGDDVINRSWAAVIVLPDAPDAVHGLIILYTARTSSGWRPWYLYFPYPRSGELIAHR